MHAGGGGTHIRRSSETAVYLAEKIRPLEPPVPEQLGVEWRYHHVPLPVLASRHRLGKRNSPQQLHEVRRVIGGAAARGGGIIGLLLAEVHPVARHTPKLETARPADLMELEVGAVSRISCMAAPHLERRHGIAHQRSHRGAAATGPQAIG